MHKEASPVHCTREVSLIGDGADSLEATQEAHLALLSAALTYDGVKCEGVTFGLYASVCVANRLKSYLRLRRRIHERSERLKSDELSVSVDVEGALAAKEFCERVLKTADELLSKFEASVFRLQLEGYPTREIADKLGKSSKSVDNAKNRLSAKLRSNDEIRRLFSDLI